MASMTRSTTPSRSGPRPQRRGVEPSRKRLGGAVAMVVIGSFLPWVDTGVGTISGARGAGLWTFYVAMLGLAAALVPSRRLAGIQAAVMGLVCVGLTTWQVVHMLQLVGVSGWIPGPGLVLVFGGGVLAAAASWGLLRSSAPA